VVNLYLKNLNNLHLELPCKNQIQIDFQINNYLKINLLEVKRNLKKIKNQVKKERKFIEMQVTLLNNKIKPKKNQKKINKMSEKKD
jgi:hypothetical protein